MPRPAAPSRQKEALVRSITVAPWSSSQPRIATQPTVVRPGVTESSLLGGYACAAELRVGLEAMAPVAAVIVPHTLAGRSEIRPVASRWFASPGGEQHRGENMACGVVEVPMSLVELGLRQRSRAQERLALSKHREPVEGGAGRPAA
jgi:hypothetical protein